MKKILFSALFCLFVVFVFTQCATIIHGSKQSVSISSNPSKANVTIDGKEMGITPLTLKLARAEHHTVVINLAGYMPYETKLTRKVDGWIAGNIIFGGLIGLVIDAAGGGMYKLTPDQVQAELRNQTTQVGSVNDGIFLSVVLSPKSEWEKVGQLRRAN